MSHTSIAAAAAVVASASTTTGRSGRNSRIRNRRAVAGGVPGSGW